MLTDRLGVGAIVGRYIGNLDANHASIIDSLKQCGYPVYDCSRFGEGFPDILVRAHGRFIPMEIKTEAGVLTPAQVKWWREMGCDPIEVRSLDEALAVIKQACR